MSRHIRYIFLYMLEPQYLAIYTCCDKVGLGAKHAEYNLLVSLLSSLSHHAATVYRTLQDKLVGKRYALTQKRHS